MTKKIIVFSLIAWAIAALSSARPAGANALIPLRDVTSVVVTGKYRSSVSSVCGRTFTKEQLMTIPGIGSVWVPVESIYNSGPKDALLIEDCHDGNFVYGLGTCGC